MEITYTKLDEEGTFRVDVESDDQEEIEDAALEWVKIKEYFLNEYDIDIPSAEQLIDYFDFLLDLVPEEKIDEEMMRRMKQRSGE